MIFELKIIIFFSEHYTSKTQKTKTKRRFKFYPIDSNAAVTVNFCIVFGRKRC